MRGGILTGPESGGVAVAMLQAAHSAPTDEEVMAANIDDGMKLAAFYMIYGGCRTDNCSDLADGSKLKAIIQHFDSDTDGGVRTQQLISALKTLRMHIIGALDAICESLQAGTIGTQGPVIQQQFDTLYPLESLGKGFTNGALTYLLKKYNIVGEDNNPRADFAANCQRAKASLEKAAAPDRSFGTGVSMPAPGSAPQYGTLGLDPSTGKPYPAQPYTGPTFPDAGSARVPGHSYNGGRRRSHSRKGKKSPKRRKTSKGRGRKRSGSRRR